MRRFRGLGQGVIGCNLAITPVRPTSRGNRIDRKNAAAIDFIHEHEIGMPGQPAHRRRGHRLVESDGGVTCADGR